MAERLAVYLYGYEVGTITRRGAEDYVFEYSEDWTNADEAVPVSLSLPLVSRVHRGRLVNDFIDNLLPDNPDVRQRWATDVGLDTVEPYYLIQEYGDDVAGALSFRRENSSERQGRRPISRARVADRIRQLRSDETAWHVDDLPAIGQFSLGGAQTKFSLARLDGQWFETIGADPSTHLFKPHVNGVRDGELVEYLVMRTAGLVGIPTAAVELFVEGGEHSLVVERFDRRMNGNGIVRLHQEDMLQALGKPRLRKFEANGGPGIDAISTLLAENADDDSRRRYAAMLAFTWLVLSTDAHAKNYSIFIEADRVRLTPLYDASSALPYLGVDRTLDKPSLLSRAGQLKLAVKYGASYLVQDVGLFEVSRIARRCGMSEQELLEICAFQIMTVPDEMARVASTMPSHLQTDTVARTVEWMPLRARQAAESLRLDGIV